MTGAAEGGLLALALDAQFDRTHFVYAAYTVAGHAGHAAVSRCALPRSRGPSRRARGAPRRHTGRGEPGRGARRRAGWPAVCRIRRGRERRARRERSRPYSGKILRLNTDGTTPEDQPAGIAGRSRPTCSLAARARLASRDRSARGRRREAAATSRSSDRCRPASGSPNHARPRMTLPAGTGAAAHGLLSRDAAVPALSGDLFVAAEDGRAPSAAALRQARSDAPRSRPSASCRTRQPHPGRRDRPDGVVFVADRPRAAAVGTALGTSALS